MHINAYTNACKHMCALIMQLSIKIILEVWGGRELGCWTTVLDTKTSPCDGTGAPSGLRYTWSMNRYK